MRTPIIDLVHVRDSISVKGAAERLHCSQVLVFNAIAANLISVEQSADGIPMVALADVDRLADDPDVFAGLVASEGKSVTPATIDAPIELATTRRKPLTFTGRPLWTVSTLPDDDKRWIEATYYATTDGRNVLQIRFRTNHPTDLPADWADYVPPQRVVMQLKMLRINGPLAKSDPPPPDSRKGAIWRTLAERLAEKITPLLNS